MRTRVLVAVGVVVVVAAALVFVVAWHRTGMSPATPTSSTYRSPARLRSTHSAHSSSTTRA